MNNVNIVYSTSGLGTPATGEDFISGMLFYGASSNVSVNCLSIDDANAAGLTASTSTSAATYTDVVNYHIAEFFRGNPTGNLFVQTITSGSSLSYAEIVDLQLSTNGKLRQVGIYEQISFSGISLAAMQAQINTCITNDMPLEVLYQPDFSGVTNLTTLTDLSSMLYPNVTVCVGQDGAALGASLFTVLGKSIGIMGIALGSVSKSKVSESIAWVANNNVASVELDTPAFANGQLFNTVSSNLVSNIDAKQYLFLRTFPMISGTYFNNDYTSNVVTSDYSSIHLNRVIHKAARSVKAALLPSLASPIFFNADGTIAINSAVFFKRECDGAMETMQSNGEISQFKTILNVKQNVLATKTLNLTLQIIPVGCANTITVNLGFVLSV